MNRAFCLWLALVLLASCRQKSSSVTPYSKHGLMDLSTWNFSDKAILKLDGDWEYFDACFIVSDSTSCTANKINVSVPLEWNNYLGRVSQNGYGYGSFRLTVLTNPNYKYGIHIKDLANAGRIYVNKKLVYQAGVAARTPEQHVPQYKPAYVFLDTDTDRFEIIAEVSNFSHLSGGLWSGIDIGRREQINLSRERELIVSFFLFGAIFIMGLFHSVLYLVRREERAYLNFGLFCFIISISSLFRSRMLFYYFEDINWELSNKIEYLSILLCLPLFYSFFYLSYKKYFSQLARKISFLIGYGLSLIVCFSAVAFYSYLLGFIQIILVVYALLIIYQLIKTLFDKRHSTWVLIAGFILFFVTLVHDILLTHNYIQGDNLVMYGVFAFIIMQAFFLAVKNALTYKRVEALSQSLLKTNRALEKFVPSDFLHLLDKPDITSVELGNNIEREMTIMFSDIRAFTVISESMTPQKAFEFINEYLKKMGPVIRKHNGFIDKYIGDGIMALFPNNNDDAVNAAKEMIHCLKEFNEDNKLKNLPLINIGIGIHTGPCMLGTVGEYERMDSTVISDSVNLAARIESLTKHYRTQIIISEETFKGLSGNAELRYRYIGIARVKGKSLTTKLYEILPGEEINPEHISLFHSALELYMHKKFENAKAGFENLGAIYPEDGVVAYYLEHTLQYMNKGLGDNWNAFEVFEY